MKFDQVTKAWYVLDTCVAWVEKGWGRSRTRRKKPREKLTIILEPQGQPVFNGCLVISNHFLCKDWESSNWWPTIYKWLALEFQIYQISNNFGCFLEFWCHVLPFLFELKKAWNPNIVKKNLQLPKNHKLLVRFWKFIQVCLGCDLFCWFLVQNFEEHPKKNSWDEPESHQITSSKNHINFRRFTSQIAPEKKRQQKLPPSELFFFRTLLTSSDISWGDFAMIDDGPGPFRLGMGCIFSHLKELHPWRLTWNIIMEVWKIIFLSKWVICRFHVNLPGCKRLGNFDPRNQETFGDFLKFLPRFCCFTYSWNSKQPVFNGCLVISNHFLYKGLESSNWWPTIYKWLALEFQVGILWDNFSQTNQADVVQLNSIS